jgi:hypothetical protein
MAWSREQSPPLVLRASPSLLYNNLCSFGHYLVSEPGHKRSQKRSPGLWCNRRAFSLRYGKAYARRDEVVVSVENKSPRRAPGQRAVQQAPLVQQVSPQQGRVCPLSPPERSCYVT